MVRDYNDAHPINRVGGMSVYGNHRKDGWANVMAGLGNRNLDKTENTYFGDMPFFTDNELSRMYMGEGMAARVVDLLPQDATREWIEFNEDPDKKIYNEMKRLNAKQAFKQALSWSRLYRGAVIVMVEQGGNVDLAKPLSANPKGLMGLRVYSAARIDVQMTSVVNDPRSRYFDDIEEFPIRFMDGIPHPVHASRCLIFKGEQSPDETNVDFKYKYWGTPFIMKVYDRMKNWGGVEKGIANLMMEFNLGKYTLSNLAQILSSNDNEAIEQIYNRLDVINASKSMINAVLLGEGEAFDRDSAALGGVSDVMDRMMISLAAVSGYPVSRLWQRSPSGLNASGDSDIRQYYDDVASVQETKMEGPLKRLADIIGGYTGVPDSSFEFKSLWQPTEKEKADTDKVIAETDKLYYDMQVIDGEELRAERFPELSAGLPIDEETEEEEDV